LTISDSPQGVYDSLLKSWFLPFVVTFVLDPLHPSVIPETLGLLRSLLLAPNRSCSVWFESHGLLETLNSFLSIRDVGVIRNVVQCMAYSTLDLGACGVFKKYNISSEWMSNAISEFPELESCFVELCRYFLWYSPFDPYYVDLLCFLLTRYSPLYDPNWLFPLLINEVKTNSSFPFDLLVDTGFLASKLAHYFVPTDRILMILQTSAAVNGRADLSCFALRFARLCYANWPSAIAGIVMPEDVLKLAQDPGEWERVVGVALKFLGDLIERKSVLNMVWHLGLKSVIVNALRVGSFVAKIGCLWLCSALMRFGDPEQTEFLTDEAFVRECMELVDDDAPNLARAAIDFLTTLVEKCLVMPYYDVVHVGDLDEFMDRLEGISLAHRLEMLGDRAFKLMRVIGEVLQAERIGLAYK
jgi:hypothetical protein